MIERHHQELMQESVALFSDCEKYRYKLTRTWDTARNGVAYLMLNPSTADEMKNDPTIARCQLRAIGMGYGRITIVNLFPYRMTDSTQLYYSSDDLIGDIDAANNAIIEAVESSEMTICGWGSHPLATARAEDVFAMLLNINLQGRLHCLKQNKNGSPMHPLYVGYSVVPTPYQPILASMR